MSAQSPKNKPNLHTIDLNFKDKPGAIAAYLLPHEQGGVLIETGPASTLPALVTGIQSHGLTVEDITDVFVTHIHLDHAGASGWLARQGAHIHVHPQGAPHLVDPEKLLASASRLYGDEMHSLWGDFLPVPEAQIRIPQDGEEIRIDGLRIKPLTPPGTPTTTTPIYPRRHASPETSAARVWPAPGTCAYPCRLRSSPGPLA